MARQASLERCWACRTGMQFQAVRIPARERVFTAAGAICVCDNVVLSLCMCPAGGTCTDSQVNEEPRFITSFQHHAAKSPMPTHAPQTAPKP